MAEIKPRIGNIRTKLETVIPLEAPFLVFLDPSDLCNAECKFCPTGNRSMVRKYRRPQIMDFSLYTNIIRQLSSFRDIKTLRLYKDGEPLLNPYFTDMVAFAKDYGCFNEIDTTTNGRLFTTQIVRALANCGLSKIFISVPANYSAKYLGMVSELYSRKTKMDIYVKIIGDSLPCGGIDKFYEDFDKISDYMFVENLAPCWPNFDVLGRTSDAGIYGNELTSVNVCPYVFYSLAINSNGTASLCFLDWQHRMILGDLIDTHISKIWNGNQHLYYQKMMLDGSRRFHPFCCNCGQLTHGNPDNIDQYASELLERIEAYEHPSENMQPRQKAYLPKL
jgi:MoaA/NifB/PqqE/SkfB family radical SAM enzyme